MRPLLACAIAAAIVFICFYAAVPSEDQARQSELGQRLEARLAEIDGI